MSTFELATNVKSKITDVVVLSQKNRAPDDNPGAQLSFAMQLPNHELTMFDGSLKAFLYTKNASSSSGQQESLDGIEPVTDLPNLSRIGAHIGRIHWDGEFTGYTLVIDHGMGGASNIEVTDCVLSKFRIAAQEGGTVALDFMLESQDVAANVFGKLATLKNREVEITLVAPEVAQQDFTTGNTNPVPFGANDAGGADINPFPVGADAPGTGAAASPFLTPEAALAAAVGGEAAPGPVVSTRRPSRLAAVKAAGEAA